jgi:hypothetical protein
VKIPIWWLAAYRLYHGTRPGRDVGRVACDHLPLPIHVIIHGVSSSPSDSRPPAARTSLLASRLDRHGGTVAAGQEGSRRGGQRPRDAETLDDRLARWGPDAGPNRTQRLLNRAVWDTFVAMGQVRRLAWWAWSGQAGDRADAGRHRPPFRNLPSGGMGRQSGSRGRPSWFAAMAEVDSVANRQNPLPFGQSDSTFS